MQRPQVARDADTIYQAAYEWHGAISLHDARELGLAWSPRSRVDSALHYLQNEGLAEMDLVRARPFLRLTNLSWPWAGPGHDRSSLPGLS